MPARSAHTAWPPVAIELPDVAHLAILLQVGHQRRLAGVDAAPLTSPCAFGK
jgi:hypothetical protein